MSRIKIFIIMYQDFSKNFGATIKYSEMMEYLSSFFEVILVCSKGGPLKSKYKTYEVKIDPPQRKDLKNHSLFWIFSRYMLFFLYQIYTVIKLLIKHRNVSYVHIRHDTYSSPSSILLYLFGKKIIADGKIFSSYALKDDKRLRIFGKIIILYEMLILKLYWKFYVCSSNYADELLEYKISPEKLFCIPACVNSSKIPFWPISESNIYNICYFGELHDYSNVKTLIKAFEISKKTIEKLKLYIVGNGECFDSLSQFAKNSSFSQDIVFKGYLPHKELMDFFNEFCVVVNPTELFSGIISTKTIEALAGGKVVIEAKPTQSNYFDLHKSAIIFYYPNNEVELSKKIVSLYLDTSKVYEYSKNSLKLAQEYYNIDNYNVLVNMFTEVNADE